MSNISNEERERQLNECIKVLHAKNAMIEQHWLEMEKERQLAEQHWCQMCKV
jgi:hypothetical protein